MIKVGDIVASRYRIESELGSGGMGVVYLAHDRKLETRVAIKCPYPSLMQDAEFAGRFQNEVKSLVTLSHPHIVKVHDVGTFHHVPFVVMQCLAGGSLEDVAQHEYSSSSPQVHLNHLRRWLPDIAVALDFMHRKGFIHRDVKPGNIMFDTEGNPYLGDFSIAKVTFAAQENGGSTGLTRTGTVMGTPEYMAPELAMGEKYDHTVDQYALAATVFETLAGHTPYTGATPAAVLLNQSTQKIPLLHQHVNWLLPVTSQVTLRALSKDGRERFPSCREFADALLATLPDGLTGGTPDIEPEEKVDGVARLQCPKCERTLRLNQQHAGKRIKCPSCANRLRVGQALDSLRLLESNAENAGQTVAVSAVTTVRHNQLAVDQQPPNVRRGAELINQLKSNARLSWLISGLSLAVAAAFACMLPTSQPAENEWLEQLIRKSRAEQRSNESRNANSNSNRSTPATMELPTNGAGNEPSNSRLQAAANRTYDSQGVEVLKSRLRQHAVAPHFNTELRNRLLLALDRVNLNTHADQQFSSLTQQFLDKAVTNSEFVSNVEQHIQRLLPAKKTTLPNDAPSSSTGSASPAASISQAAMVPSLSSAPGTLHEKPGVEDADPAKSRCHELIVRRKELADQERTLSGVRQQLEQKLAQAIQQLQLVQAQGTALTRDLAQMERVARELKAAQTSTADFNERRSLQNSLDSLSVQYNSGKITVAGLQREAVSSANAVRAAEADLALHTQSGKEALVSGEVSQLETEWLAIVETAGPLHSGKYVFVIEQSTDWLSCDPNSSEALMLRAMSHCFGPGDHDKALRDIETLLQQDPNSSELVAFKAFVIGRAGNSPKARSLFERARRLKNPTDLVYSLNGRFRWESHDFRRANADYRKALSLNSQNLLTKIWLAELLATCPEDDLRDGRQALNISFAACAATNPPRWDALAVHAAAHAELENFSRAIDVAAQALALSPDSENEQCRKRIHFYEQKRKWRALR